MFARRCRTMLSRLHFLAETPLPLSHRWALSPMEWKVARLYVYRLKFPGRRECPLYCNAPTAIRHSTKPIDEVMLRNPPAKSKAPTMYTTQHLTESLPKAAPKVDCQKPFAAKRARKYISRSIQPAPRSDTDRAHKGTEGGKKKTLKIFVRERAKIRQASIKSTRTHTQRGSKLPFSKITAFHHSAGSGRVRV